MAAVDQDLMTAAGLRVVIAVPRTQVDHGSASPELRPEWSGPALSDIASDLLSLDVLARLASGTLANDPEWWSADEDATPDVVRIHYRNPLEVVLALAPIFIGLPAILKTIRDWDADKQRAAAKASIAKDHAELYRQLIDRIGDRVDQDDITLPVMLIGMLESSMSSDQRPEAVEGIRNVSRAIDRLRGRVLEVEPVDPNAPEPALGG
jgi:hypothetical protein